MTLVNFTFTGSEAAAATSKLLNATALEILDHLGASDLIVSYQAVVTTTTTTSSPTTASPVAGGGGNDDGLSQQNLILAIVLPIVGVMLIAALVYCCVVNRQSDNQSRSFAFGSRKEEIKFDEYLAIIDGPAEMMNLEERML